MEDYLYDIIGGLFIRGLLLGLFFIKKIGYFIKGLIIKFLSMDY